MGSKGCRLWVMGQLDSNVQSPTAVGVERDGGLHVHCVVAQAEFI
jgi:hypothetical protein